MFFQNKIFLLINWNSILISTDLVPLRTCLDSILSYHLDNGVTIQFLLESTLERLHGYGVEGGD